MATVLETTIPIPIEIIEEEPEKIESSSLWIKSGNVIKPSENIIIFRELNPGLYSVDYDRNLGFYCQEQNFISDELYLFSDSQSNTIVNEILSFINKRELYKNNNILHKRGILLVGSSGTGKTSIINQILQDLSNEGVVSFNITDPDNLLNYIDFITYYFRKIQKDTPIVTILEDLEKYYTLESDLSNFLDGRNNIDNHIVLATSNNTTNISDLILRPSRFDLKIEIPLPSENTRREYFKFKKVDSSIIEELVMQTKGFSIAELKEVFISVFLLKYPISDTLKRIGSKYQKRNFRESKKNNQEIGIN